MEVTFELRPEAERIRCEDRYFLGKELSRQKVTAFANVLRPDPISRAQRTTRDPRNKVGERRGKGGGDWMGKDGTVGVGPQRASQ